MSINASHRRHGDAVPTDDEIAVLPAYIPATC